MITTDITYSFSELMVLEPVELKELEIKLRTRLGDIIHKHEQAAAACLFLQKEIAKYEVLSV